MNACVRKRVRNTNCTLRRQRHGRPLGDTADDGSAWSRRLIRPMVAAAADHYTGAPDVDSCIRLRSHTPQLPHLEYGGGGTIQRPRPPTQSRNWFSSTLALLIRVDMARGRSVRWRETNESLSSTSLLVVDLSWTPSRLHEVRQRVAPTPTRCARVPCRTYRFTPTSSDDRLSFVRLL